MVQANDGAINEQVQVKVFSNKLGSWFKTEMLGGGENFKTFVSGKKGNNLFCRRGFVSGLCNLLVCAFACGSRACAVAVGVRSGAEVLGVATFHLFFRFSFSVSSFKFKSSISGCLAG